MNTKKTGEAPGKIQVCVLPEDLSSVDEEHPLKFEVLKVLIWLKNMHWKFGWIYMEEEFAKRSRIKFIGIKKAELGWLLAH